MYNILVVDDEKIEREGIRFLIEEYGLSLNPSEAVNGNAALEYIRNHEVQILLTDIKMPFMDGLELAAKAREISPDIEIIIFSAYSEFDYARKAMALNVLHYILKPVNIEEFLEIMSKVIMACKNREQQREREKILLEVYNRSKMSTETDENVQEGNEKPGVDENEKKAIGDVLKYIHDNYMKDISLESAAEYVYLSPGYLSSFFKKETGQSLIKYITEFRLERARELLQNTNMKIVDVARKVGYSNNSYFCMAFRSYFGKSPAKYRKKGE